MNNEKIEIINVNLGINLAEEIKQKVDSLSTRVIEFTKKVVKRNGVKIQDLNKKKKAKKERTEKAELAVKFLMESLETPDRWVEGHEILEAAGTEITAQNVNKVAMQIRKILEKEDKWTLSRKRRAGKTVYRLAKFG